MDRNRLPSFLLSLILHLGVFALVLFWPVPETKLPQLTGGPMLTGLVTIKPGQSQPGARQEKPLQGKPEARPSTLEKPADQAQAKPPAQIETPAKPEAKPEVKPVEKPKEPDAVPIPKEPEKPKEQPKPKEPEKPVAKKPEQKPEKKPEEKKPAPKKDDLASALASLEKDVKKSDSRQGARRGSDSVSGALDDLKKKAGGPGDGGEGQGSGGPGDGVGRQGSYTESIISRVKPNWSFTTPVQRQSLVAVVNIQIAADGTILTAQVVQPSGNPLFDGSLIAAITVTGRLEPPPDPEMMNVNILFTPDALRQ